MIDNGELSPEQTVDAILEHILQGIINFRRLGPDLITGGQPTEEQLAAVVRAGVEVAINLGRLDPAYALPDERGTVQALGMIYEHIPVTWAEPQLADLKRFFEAMERHHGRRLFVHCAANYRASAFIALYRVLRLEWKIEDAMVDVRAIWEPNETWRAFMESALAEGAKS